MGFGAALAGGAQGVLGAWEDNREAIKAEADRAFKIKLEEERARIGKETADQLASDMMNPETPQGLLAQRNSEAEKAKLDREYENNRLDRESRERVSMAKDGKGDKIPSKVKLAYDMSKAIGEMEAPTPEDLRQKAFYDKIISDHVGGMEPDQPTANDMEALRRGDVTIEQFSDRFGGDAGSRAAQQIELERKASKQQSSDKGDRKEKTRKPTLADKYPSKGKGMIAGAIDMASDVSSAFGGAQSDVFKDKANNAITRVSEAIKKGAKVRGEDLNILEAAYHQPWLTDDERAIIDEAYKRAKGYQ